MLFRERTTKPRTIFIQFQRNYNFVLLYTKYLTITSTISTPADHSNLKTKGLVEVRTSGEFKTNFRTFCGKIAMQN